MHYIRLLTQPVGQESFRIPKSTGYQTYAGLLSLLDAGDDDAGDAVHDGRFASLRNSGVIGQFGASDTYPKHKRVLGSETYEIVLSIIDETDVDIYRALLDAVALNGKPIPLAHGELEVDGIETDTTNFDEILEQAAIQAQEADGIRLTFETMACLIDGQENEVSTPFPSRDKVFSNLQFRWNRAVEQTTAGDSDKHSLEINQEAIRNAVYTQGTGSNFRGDWQPVSRVVNRETPQSPSEAEIVPTAHTTASGDTVADGGADPIDVGHGGGRMRHLQGFTGEFEYYFKKEAGEPTRAAIMSLGLAAPYLNIGRAVARGPGTIKVEIVE